MQRIMLLLIVVAGVLLNATLVNAQQGPMPQREYYIGEGDVEVRTGAFAYSNTDIAIGRADQGGALALTRYFAAIQQGVGVFGPTTSHNFEIRLYRKKYYEPLMPPSKPSYSFHFLIGRTVTPIYCTNIPTEGGNGMPPEGSCKRKLISANGINGPFVYTAEDGTYMEFPAIGTSQCMNIGYATGTCSQPTLIVKPNGERLYLGYDFSPVSPYMWRLRSVVSTRGYALGFDYTAAGSAISKVCVVNLAVQFMSLYGPCPPNARAATYGYLATPYGSPPLVSYTDSAGAVTNYSYGSSYYQIVGIRNPGSANNDLTNVYNPTTGRIAQQTYADGSAWSYTYQNIHTWEIQPYNDWTVVTNPLGQQTRHEFTGELPNVVIDPLLRRQQYKYVQSRTLIERETTPEGNYVEYSYDIRENRKQSKLVAKVGSGLADRIMQSEFSLACTSRVTCNKPLYSIDARGNRTDYTYDTQHGGVLTETLPAAAPGEVRPQKRFSYEQLYAWYKDPAGNVVRAPSPIWMLAQISECSTLASCAGTADETVTTFTYGTAGVANNLLLTSRTVRAGDNSVSATTSWTYDEWGNTLTEDGPLPGSADTSRTRYDAMNRVIGAISADPDGAGPLLHRAIRTTYDDAGRVRKTERGVVTGQSDAEWNAFAAMESTDFFYDVVGRLVKTTRNGGGSTYAVTQTNYDGAWRPECNAVRMDPAQWNGQSNACVPQTTGPQGPDRIAKNIYDEAGQLITKQLGVGTVDATNEETYTYSLNGKQRTVKDGENNLTTFEYDGFDRLAKTRYPVATLGAESSSTTDYEQLTYDANNNVTQRRLRDGQVINSPHDALNRPRLKDLPAPEVDVTYGYDLQGHVLSLVQGSGDIIRTYDALGRTESESTTRGVVSYKHDEASRRIRTTWPDGFFVTQDYLVTGEATAIRENGAGSGIGVLATYQYDQLGRRASIARGNGTVTHFGYDAVSRLAALAQDLTGATQDVLTTFTYNPASQIATWSRNNDAYAWASHFNLNRQYAVNGLNQFTTAGSDAFVYDGRGNMMQWGPRTYTYTTENRLVTGPNGSTFAYDPLGRLSQSTGTSGTTRFQYDGTDLIAEYNASNQLVRRYVHGPGADEPLVWYEGATAANRRWLHQDERSSTVAVTNEAGATIALNSYDEYGIPSPTNLGRFQYTGQTWLPELGVYYYKARIYSATLGRFLQTDPIGYGDGVNLYAYVGGDPLNRVDPTGEIFETVWDVANLAMGVASLSDNIASGNVGGAVVDAAGLVVDGLATVVPVLPAGAGTAIKAIRGADKAREVLKANKAQGKVGEAMTANKLGDKVAGKQVSFKTSDGKKTRQDFVTTDKGTVETKTGNAKLSEGQEKFKSDVDAGRPVTPVGQNAEKAGLKPGEPTVMKSCTIDRPC